MTIENENQNEATTDATKGEAKEIGEAPQDEDASSADAELDEILGEREIEMPNESKNQNEADTDVTKVETKEIDEATQIRGVNPFGESNESKEFSEGREAGLAGLTDADNPYPIGSDEAMDWEDGRASVEAGEFESENAATGGDENASETTEE